MKKTIIITLFLLVSSLFVKAQQNTQSHAQPDSIIKVVPVTSEGHKAYAYAIGGKVQTLEEVKIKLMAYAPSANEFYKAKKETEWAYVSTAGFGLSTIAAIVEYVHNNKSSGDPYAQSTDTQHHSFTGTYIFTGIAAAFFTSAVINLVNASKHKSKALKVYNQRFE